MFNVNLKEIINEFQLKEVTQCTSIDQINIITSDVNRPGLQLAKFVDYFGTDRIQIIGKVETSYLWTLSPDERYLRLNNLFKLGFPCVVVCRGLEIFPEMIKVAQKYDIPIFKTSEITSHFISSLIKYLNVQLAPRIQKHGVFVEVYGEGILILGESGVGKSETALELIKRGHRLVADDLVEIRRVSDKTLVGTAPDLIRHFIEIRGIGILDIKHLFGLGSVKMTETISLVISLELWNENKSYERLGLTDELIAILGIEVPCITLPVRPGRNLAVICEVAAINNRQKKMGYNAALALNSKIMEQMNNDSE